MSYVDSTRTAVRFFDDLVFHNEVKTCQLYYYVNYTNFGRII